VEKHTNQLLHVEEEVKKDYEIIHRKTK